MNLVLCKVCHIRPAMFNEDRCENCWADDQQRYDGRKKVQNVHTMVKSSRDRDCDDASASHGETVSRLRKGAPRE